MGFLFLFFNAAFCCWIKLCDYLPPHFTWFMLGGVLRLLFTVVPFDAVNMVQKLELVAPSRLPPPCKEKLNERKKWIEKLRRCLFCMRFEPLPPWKCRLFKKGHRGKRPVKKVCFMKFKKQPRFATFLVGDQSSYFCLFFSPALSNPRLNNFKTSIIYGISQKTIEEEMDHGLEVLLRNKISYYLWDSHQRGFFSSSLSSHK